MPAHEQLDGSRCFCVTMVTAEVAMTCALLPRRRQRKRLKKYQYVPVARTLILPYLCLCFVSDIGTHAQCSRVRYRLSTVATLLYFSF